MEKIIKAAVERGASDLHIKAGDVFRARIDGRLVPLTKQALTARTRDTSPPGLPVPLPAHQPRFRLLTRGAELPSDEELARNPRAASARLRAAERIRVDD